MQGQPKRRGDRDLRAQSVVLGFILDQHPNIHPSIPSVVHDLAEEASDAYERAVRDLTSAGLLRCPDGIVYPTEAALRFDRLALP
jgi:hypothetical protein